MFIPVAEIKSKGLTTYVITDLANVYFNCQYSSADKLIYVTDSRQFKHFILLFKHIYEIYNIYYIKKLKFIHFLFGSVSFSNNIPIASRGGNNVNLMTFLFKIKKKLNINFESYKKFSKCYKISLYYIKSFDFSTNKFCNYSVIELLKTLKTQVNSNFIIFLAYTLNKIEEHFIKKRYIKNKNLRYVYEEIIWFKYILIKIEFFEYNLQQVFKKLSPKTLMSYSLDFLNWIYKKINYFKVNSLTINIIIKCKWVLLTTLNIL
ncbi:arginine--tRNA ligase [Candidatus Pinguicoccus supinus]|uniref:Arginine--tRNA ligase n=1 Tax=Candidatus Pinguicoccus supinus TaxID=2529394 RepID=A0A7T0BSF8_9BACT|nr:arginine--tRNA ligase [Candidatus Pinguicoccus supinus]